MRITASNVRLLNRMKTVCWCEHSSLCPTPGPQHLMANNVCTVFCVCGAGSMLPATRYASLHEGGSSCEESNLSAATGLQLVPMLMSLCACGAHHDLASREGPVSRPTIGMCGIFIMVLFLVGTGLGGDWGTEREQFSFVSLGFEPTPAPKSDKLART